MRAHLALNLDPRQSGLITDKTAGSLPIAERGHVLVAELQQFTAVLQRAIDQIRALAPMETRAPAVNGVIGIVLDPHILSRAREERDLCVGALHEARARDRDTGGPGSSQLCIHLIALTRISNWARDVGGSRTCCARRCRNHAGFAEQFK
jgi:hypothetical protein